jgi:hypothetical protein
MTQPETGDRDRAISISSTRHLIRPASQPDKALALEEAESAAVDEHRYAFNA